MREQLDNYVKGEKKSFLSRISYKLESKLNNKKGEGISLKNIRNIGTELMNLKIFGEKIKELHGIQTMMAKEDLSSYTIEYSPKLPTKTY